MIRLYHVHKHFDNGAHVLKGVNLTLEKGDLAFLTGPSGAGKTTLLRLLIAAETPSRGQVMVSGYRVNELPRNRIPYLRRLFGFVYQDFKLLQRRTVLENVMISLEVVGENLRSAERRAKAILGRVGLTHRMEALPRHLSGGEQQRVAIARALVNDPPLLLADEPTGNLDPETTEGVIELFKWANLRGTTILVATHDEKLVSSFDGRILTLDDGKLFEREQGEWD